MKISELLISVLLITAVVVGFTQFMGQMAYDYGVPINNTSFNESFDFLAETQEDTSDMQPSTLEEPPLEGAVADFFISIGKAIRIYAQSIAMFVIMGNAVFGEDGLIGGNPYIPLIIATIVTIIVVMLIANYLFRKEDL